MKKPSPDDACLDEWLEMRDLETLKVEGATWLPLYAADVLMKVGESGHVGFREEYVAIESLIVPMTRRQELNNLNWQSISRNGSDTGWADEDGLTKPGLHDADRELQYPVLVQTHDTGEESEWHLLQELQLALNLRRVQDEWIAHAENDLVVARIKRGENGRPSRLDVRAEHLRDYLCAKQACLLIGSFQYRQAVEREVSAIGLPEQIEDRIFSTGHWDGAAIAIHEGGRPYGMGAAVMTMWRESVDPETDNPTMPQPWEDQTMRSETKDVTFSGEKLWSGEGRIWTKAWVEPASVSPRIRRDKVESTIHFLVDNQEHKTLAGSALTGHRGWLWFKPSVISALLKEKKAHVEWHTRETGTIGPDSIQTLHFGVNGVGLINVVAYKMAALPVWVQQLWVAHNTPPDGGLSQELHMAQNLGRPAATSAPERALLHNLRVLNQMTEERFGVSLLRGELDDLAFYRSVHRFHASSFEDYCRLCKELHRNVAERIDIGAINSKLDPANAAEANKQKLREIKRLAFWLDKLGYDGRQMTQAFAAVCDLRVGDAHAGKTDLRDSLPLLGIPSDAEDIQRMCMHTIGAVAYAIAAIGKAIEEHKQKEPASTLATQTASSSSP